MIFVTVGTHEQPFDRLVKHMDFLKQQKIITDKVVIQTGFSTYAPECCQWKNIYPYQEMVAMVNEARIVITHGGPSSFLMPLQIGKIPIVVPRQHQYKEHVNDHQVLFSRTVAERLNNIIVVEDISTLEDVLLNYEAIAAKMTSKIQSNNSRFMEEFESIVNGMF